MFFLIFFLKIFSRFFQNLHKLLRKMFPKRYSLTQKLKSDFNWGRYFKLNKSFSKTLENKNKRKQKRKKSKQKTTPRKIFKKKYWGLIKTEQDNPEKNLFFFLNFKTKTFFSIFKSQNKNKNFKLKGGGEEKDKDNEFSRGGIGRNKKLFDLRDLEMISKYL